MHITQVTHSPHVVLNGKRLLVDSLIADAVEVAARPPGSEPGPDPIATVPFAEVLECYDAPPTEPDAPTCFQRMTRWMAASARQGLRQVRHYLRAPAAYSAAAPRRSVIAAMVKGHAEGVQQLLVDLMQRRLSPDAETYHRDLSAAMYVLVDIRRPAPQVIEVVRRMAFRLDGWAHHDEGAGAARQTQRQAILMVGTLAHRLYREGQEGSALLLIDDILDHIDAHVDSQWMDGLEVRARLPDHCPVPHPSTDLSCCLVAPEQRLTRS